MSELTDLLADAGRRLEPEIRSRLNGMLGGILRAYIPQCWEFRTDAGAATLTVGPDGASTAAEGLATAPDVTIEIPFATLRTALTTRTRAPGSSTSIRVTPHTTKGRAAFDYLRGRIGL